MTEKINSMDQGRQIRNLNALLEVSRLMGAEVRLDDLLQIIINKTTEVMDAARSSLFIYDESKDELWSKVAEGLEIKEIRFPLGVGIAGDVAKTRKTANIPDAYEDPRFNPDFDRRTEYRTRSILCMPVVTNEGKLIGVIEVLNKEGGKSFNQDDESLLEALAAHVAVALERAQLTEAFVEKKKIEEALRLAGEIQMGILPRVFPPFPDKDQFEIFASIRPAKEVGGDFYDFFLIDEDRLCFVIGDVSDKGIPAALFMAVTKTLMKATAKETSSPDEVLFKVNNELCHENESGMFVTLFCGILDIMTGEILYSNGGHNRPYVISERDGVQPISTPAGVALGVIDDFEFELRDTTLGKGDSMYLYTDGVNEAMDHKGNEFSYARLERFLANVRGSTATEIADGSIAAVEDFINGATQSDDITVMAIRYLQ